MTSPPRSQPNCVVENAKTLSRSLRMIVYMNELVPNKLLTSNAVVDVHVVHHPWEQDNLLNHRRHCTSERLAEKEALPP